MNKIKKILIATDLSPLSLSAIDRGLEIAKKCNATVTILNILEKGFFDEMRKEALPPSRNQLIKPREYAHQLINEKITQSKPKKVKINIVIEDSKKRPPIKIINYAKKTKTDIIIIGSHGRFKFHDWFVGTTAEYIVKKTRCPVLITKKMQKVSYKRILLPIDFSNASKAAVDFGYHLFPDSHFYVLNVGDQAYDDLVKTEHLHLYGKGKRLKKEIMTLLMNKAKEFISNKTNKKKQFSFQVKIGHAGLVILREAKKPGINLVVMGTHGHNQYHYRWLGSVANRVLIEIDKDILLVPPQIKRRKKSAQKDSYIKRITALTEEHFKELKESAKK